MPVKKKKSLKKKATKKKALKKKRKRFFDEAKGAMDKKVNGHGAGGG